MIAEEEGVRAASSPAYGHHWDIAVLLGPHTAPEFFTPEDMERFFASDWEVHYHSSRTGVRLIGPKPQWARRDGGEAGLHPSNIHDNAYTVGAIDFTGDMPVILGPDGPSLGGFVCPAAVALAELWKVGQLRPGDRVRFHPIPTEQARALLLEQDQAIRTLRPMAAAPVAHATAAARPLAPKQRTRRQEERRWLAVLAQRPASPIRPAVCYRQSGEDNILIEYGEPTLDLSLRFRIQALLEALRADPLPGILDLTPGVRSLQVHFDCRRLEREALLERLLALEERLPRVEDLEVDSRIVHLPLSWDDPTTRLAIERYMRSVRSDAPWCPSNIEFIRRINGLDSVEDVRRIVFDASYLVMGLGDVYLGAPVATPLDPRHRLITTKYNPARTWTPENAVGIGGAYLCVYGMEGPGGYQFVGRTVQMWNRYHRTAEFPGEERHLLRFFDQLRFYPVSAEELERLRADFPLGKAHLVIEPTRLRLRDYQGFLSRNAASIAAFRGRAREAFEAERERWRESAQESELLDAEALADVMPAPGAPAASQILPVGCVAVRSPVSGSVWQLNVQVGQRIDAGTTLLVIEAMKTEIAVPAVQSGTVVELYCRGGQGVGVGETLLALRS
jgi:urea carboxylase